MQASPLHDTPVRREVSGGVCVLGPWIQRGRTARPASAKGIRDNRSRNSQGLPAQTPHGSLTLACSTEGEQTMSPTTRQQEL